MQNTINAKFTPVLSFCRKILFTQVCCYILMFLLVCYLGCQTSPWPYDRVPSEFCHKWSEMHWACNWKGGQLVCTNWQNFTSQNEINCSQTPCQSLGFSTKRHKRDSLRSLHVLKIWQNGYIWFCIEALHIQLFRIDTCHYSHFRH